MYGFRSGFGIERTLAETWSKASASIFLDTPSLHTLAAIGSMLIVVVRSRHPSMDDELLKLQYSGYARDYSAFPVLHVGR